MTAEDWFVRVLLFGNRGLVEHKLGRYEQAIVGLNRCLAVYSSQGGYAGTILSNGVRMDNTTTACLELYSL